MAAQKARLLHQRVCTGTPCNPSLPIPWASEHVASEQAETATRRSAESSWASPIPSHPAICHLQTLILSVSCRGRETGGLFEADGGSPASAWLSGSQHPSTAIQQAAHEELLEVPEPAASNSISQVIQGGSWVSGYEGGTTIITGGALPQGHTAHLKWLQLA